MKILVTAWPWRTNSVTSGRPIGPRSRCMQTIPASGARKNSQLRKTAASWPLAFRGL
jgi:hypothetical protein